MTEEQINLAKRLGKCRFLPASSQKRFARDMAWNATHKSDIQLTAAQEKYLMDLAYLYRKQLEKIK